MNISFTDRLKCPHSYSTDDNKNLLCDYNIGDGICDGTLWEHCCWDKDYDEELRLIYDGNMDNRSTT